MFDLFSPTKKLATAIRQRGLLCVSLNADVLLQFGIDMFSRPFLRAFLDLLRVGVIRNVFFSCAQDLGVDLTRTFVSQVLRTCCRYKVPYIFESSLSQQLPPSLEVDLVKFSVAHIININIFDNRFIGTLRLFCSRLDTDPFDDHAVNQFAIKAKPRVAKVYMPIIHGMPTKLCHAISIAMTDAISVLR